MISFKKSKCENKKNKKKRRHKQIPWSNGPQLGNPKEKSMPLNRGKRKKTDSNFFLLEY